MCFSRCPIRAISRGMGEINVLFSVPYKGHLKGDGRNKCAFLRCPIRASSSPLQKFVVHLCLRKG